METLRAMLTCRTTAQFVPGAVISTKTQKDLLRVAMSAPFAGKESPRHFLVIREAPARGDLAELLWAETSIQSASIGIVVCADNRSQKHMGQWVVDCAAASENIVLAARDMELGSAWIRVFPFKSRMSAVGKFLRLPHYVTPFSAIFLGRSRKPLRKLGASADESKIHLEQW